MTSRLSFHASKTKVYSVLLSSVVIVGIIVFVLQWSKQSRDDFKEHFTSGGAEGDYNSRLTVIDVFDAFMKRNPTPTEITKYSVHKNEQDILMAVMKDYPNEVEKNHELVYKNNSNDVVQEEEYYVDAVDSLDKYDPTKEEEKPSEETPKDRYYMTASDMITLRKHLNNAFMILNKYTVPSA